MINNIYLIQGHSELAAIEHTYFSCIFSHLWRQKSWRWPSSVETCDL